jgi:hypothetical protein
MPKTLGIDKCRILLATRHGGCIDLVKIVLEISSRTEIKSL